MPRSRHPENVSPYTGLRVPVCKGTYTQEGGVLMLQGHTMAIVPCGNPTPKKLPTGGGEWPTFRTGRAQRTVRPLRAGQDEEVVVHMKSITPIGSRSHGAICKSLSPPVQANRPPSAASAVSQWPSGQCAIRVSRDPLFRSSCKTLDASDGKGPESRKRWAVGGGCRSGWGRLLSVTNAVEAGACGQSDSNWDLWRARGHPR